MEAISPAVHGQLLKGFKKSAPVWAMDLLAGDQMSFFCYDGQRGQATTITHDQAGYCDFHGGHG
jgi:hypothetical protein